MKKTLLTIATIALFSFNSQAQIKQGFYASLNAGYNMGTESNSNIYYGDFIQFADATSVAGSTTIEAKKLSLGKGINFGANFGYMFTKNLGTELGVGYLMGSENSVSQSSSDPSGWDKKDISLKANQIQIKPTFVIAAGYEKINPYAKLGMLIGISKTTYTQEETNSGGDIGNIEAELTGGVSLGFRASAGLNFAINDKFSIFTELTSLSSTIRPTKGEVTKVTENGINALPFMTYNDTHVEFVDSYTSGLPELDTVASKSLKPSFSGSSLGLNFGVSYHF